MKKKQAVALIIITVMLLAFFVAIIARHEATRTAGFKALAEEPPVLVSEMDGVKLWKVYTYDSEYDRGWVYFTSNSTTAQRVWKGPAKNRRQFTIYTVGE